MDAGGLLELFATRTQRQRRQRAASGALIRLPARGELLVVGDLHNHRANYDKIVSYADLAGHPERFVILQELIHGGTFGRAGEDRSMELLADALAWAAEFPEQIYFLVANHDLAQVEHAAIMKDGCNVVARFTQGCRALYGAAADAVLKAFSEFVYSQPVAAITASGIMLTHSLPGSRDMATFDPKFLQRPLTRADYEPGGAVYQLVWGRQQDATALETLARAWFSELFICGHQGQPEGWAAVEPNLLIVDSSHDQGTIAHLNLACTYDLASLVNECLLRISGTAC